MFQRTTVLFFIFLFLAEASMAKAVHLPQKIQVQGHRGARAVLPENSLPAFEYALTLGVDVLEMDLVVTKDHQLVVNHDLYLNSDICLDSQGKRLKRKIYIYQLNYSELQAYECGAMVNPKFPKQKTIPNTRIPKFEDVLTFLQKSPLPHSKKILLNIETKIEAGFPDLSPSPKKFVELILEQLNKYQILDRSILQSFDFRTIDEAFTLEPRLKRALLIESRQQDMLALAKKHHAHIISPQGTLLSKKTVQVLHQAGISVIPWTINDENGWEKMMDLGVDGIITDDPKALIDYLDS